MRAARGQPPCGGPSTFVSGHGIDAFSAGMQTFRANHEHGALDVNINAALAYDGPWDPISGSSDVRGLPCRVEAIAPVHA